MKEILYLPALMLTALSVHAALPGNIGEGRRLHDANCTRCHDTGIYTRKDHAVRSLDELKQQLEGCSHMASAEFSPAEMQSIIKYLNDEFYRFR